MQTFRSEVIPDFFEKKISYKNKSAFIGSCFTENIGKKMENLRFPVLTNPFGILYNPVSIAECISLCLKGLDFFEKDLIFFNDKWLSFKHHGRFSNEDRKEVLATINMELQLGKLFLKESNLLFLTFGTSWVYKHKETNQIVANCHKIPSNEFEHFSLGLSEIVDIYVQLLDELHRFNSGLNVIFTVSPVRHWKDGPVNNQKSKSTLILAVHELVKKFDFVSYFPSYELMMDDLRDYRFYSDDFFHPNQMAIDYIWSKFKETYIDVKSIEIAEEVNKLNKALAHRPFYPNSQAYKKFIESNIALIGYLKSRISGSGFEKDLQYLIMERKKYFGE